MFQLSHFNAVVQKWEYHAVASVCNGVCQPPKFCHVTQANWAWLSGLKGSSPAFSYCKVIGPNFVAVQPACVQSFGGYIGGFSDDCT